VNWKPRAVLLASEVTHPVSRWRLVVAAVPRHLLVPRWWARAEPGSLWHDTWELRDGPASPARWLDAAYADRSLITQVGELHADHAGPAGRAARVVGDHAGTARPDVPARHDRRRRGRADVGTGSGYGTALLATMLGDGHVTSIDLDDYLVKAAAARLASIGLHPVLAACDAAGPLPAEAESFDRIIATVAVRPVPASWLTALRPGGRLVTTITGTNLILTADKTEDGGAAGRTEWDRAGFMHARQGRAYPPAMLERFTAIRDADGDQVTAGRFPVVNVNDAWELYSTLGLVLPGIEHHYEQAPGGTRTAWMLHPDGSWARSAALGDEPPVIHQAGPQRLHDVLDRLRSDWLRDGALPAHGARVTISPDGGLTFRRGRWTATIPAD